MNTVLKIKSKDSVQGLLEKYIALNENVKLYIPSTMHDRKINNDKQVNLISEKFSKMFGGCNILKQNGCYYSEELNKVIKEEITVIESYTNELTVENMKEVIALAKKLKSSMNQECVSLEYNGELYFI